MPIIRVNQDGVAVGNFSGRSLDDVLLLLQETMGKQAFQAAIERLNQAQPDDDKIAAFPAITQVRMSIANTHKAWYEYYHVYGPANGHPDYAEDWNLESMGNSDLGEPLCAPFDGVVINAEDYGGAWGKIVRVMGYDAAAKDVVVWMGAHLSEYSVSVGQIVEPGEHIARVGTAGGRYSAHLHEQISVGQVFEPTAFVFGEPFVRPSTWYIEHGVPEEQVRRMREKDND
jgi:hypothetical protein